MLSLFKKYCGWFIWIQIKGKVSMLWGIFRGKSLYFRMPKVASGTITNALSSDTVIVPHSYRPAKVRRMLSLNPVSFQFAIVRHPLTRFASAYKWATRENISAVGYPFDMDQRKIILKFDNINDF
jgi:hypothetical protein